MEENPFQPPMAQTVQQPIIGVLSGTREDLIKVAKYQKGIMFCIMGYFACSIALAVLPKEVPVIILVVALAALVVVVTGVVYVFMLAIKVFGVAPGVILGLATFLPCIGLIVLLIVNMKATSVLKQNGIHVGFFGANVADIER